MRTVKQKTLFLNTEKRRQLQLLVTAYAREKRHWVRYFQSWDILARLNQPRLIRDQFVQKRYRSPFGLQARHWKLALDDAAEIWDKYWQSLFASVRSKIAASQNMTETERHYAFWLLSGYSQFSQVMQNKKPEPPFAIEKIDRYRIANYVHRFIRKMKSKTPSVKRETTVRFDANCYEIVHHKNRQYIKLMSIQPGKRIVLPFAGKTKIDGTITLVIKDKDVHIHSSQDLKKKKNSYSAIEAVDFGYTEVMTDTEGVRYGTRFGSLLMSLSDQLSKKMQKRHKLYALAKDKNQHKKSKLLKYNLGKKKQTSRAQNTKASLEKEMNSGINQLLHTKCPSILITENLRHNFVFNKSKTINRKLSSWIKGKLQDRIEFKALAEGFRHEQVNPAYGSQSCPNCEFVDQGNRKQDRFQCLHCGYEDVSDRVAALNYARRYGDPEIGLYTPYSQVKTILMERFHRRLETGQPVTVQGRTLETAIRVRPPPLSKHFDVTVGREQSRKNQAVNQRAKRK